MKIKEFTITAIFLSIILLLALTPLGFIHLGVIKATIIHIPIIMASIILGPKIGSILGFAFGMTSIYNNTIMPSLLSFAFSPAIPVLGTDEGSFWALVVAIVPRILLGILPYYIYKGMRKVMEKNTLQRLSLFITGLLSTFIHTFMVMGLITLIFSDAYSEAIHVDSFEGIIMAVLTVFLTNGLAEAFLAAFLVSVIVPPLFKVAKIK